jgi:rod shape-determining protein MreC
MNRRTLGTWPDRVSWAVITLGLAVMLFPPRIKTSLLLPVQTVLHAPLRIVTGLNSRLADRGRENARLLRLVAELAVENARLRAMTLADRRAPGDTLNLVPATVIGRDLGTFERYLTISRGRASGLKPGDPVIAADGVVGMLVACGDHQSLVQTLLAPTARAAVMSLRSHTPGVTRPDGAGFLDIVYLPKDADYAVGDTVLTAGLGRVFPRGLLVGVVTATGADSAAAEPAGLFQPVRVRPFVNFSRLDVVFVLPLPETLPASTQPEVQSRTWLENLAPSEVSCPEESETR